MIPADRLTVRASRSLQEAAEIARSGGNPAVEDIHLLAGLLADGKLNDYARTCLEVMPDPAATKEEAEGKGREVVGHLLLIERVRPEPDDRQDAERPRRANANVRCFAPCLERKRRRVPKRTCFVAF